MSRFSGVVIILSIFLLLNSQNSFGRNYYYLSKGMIKFEYLRNYSPYRNAPYFVFQLDLDSIIYNFNVTEVSNKHIRSGDKVYSPELYINNIYENKTRPLWANFGDNFFIVEIKQYKIRLYIIERIFKIIKNNGNFEIKTQPDFKYKYDVNALQCNCSTFESKLKLKDPETCLEAIIRKKYYTELYIYLAGIYEGTGIHYIFVPEIDAFTKITESNGNERFRLTKINGFSVDNYLRYIYFRRVFKEIINSYINIFKMLFYSAHSALILE